MASNKSLAAAKTERVDEYYTQREDIEKELMHYADQFKGKRVYCNCDDPEWSEFWQFFHRMFKPWELKSLTATHYEPCAENFAYRLDLSEDTNGDGIVDWNDEPVITQIECNGDFRSEICIDMLKEADIVVTNPPFSLFREYFTQLMEYGKKFLIVCPLTGFKYKETFPYVRDNKVWMGYTQPKVFRVPETCEEKGVYEEDGVRYVKRGNTYWMTNLDVVQRHKEADLRGNYYDPEKYPSYNNFDGIDVASANEVPCDWYGNMGVPINFLEKHCSDQFEIVGLGEGNLAKEIGVQKNHRGRSDLEYPLPDGGYKRPNARIVIRRRKKDETADSNEGQSS